MYQTATQAERLPGCYLACGQDERLSGVVGLMLILLIGLIGLTGGACSGVGKVSRWEAEGNMPALKRALDDADVKVRQAAAQALVRYAAYDTVRPAVLSTLNRSNSAEARQAIKQLFGQPPQHAPDPYAPVGQALGSDEVALYLYRAADDRGEARWVSIDNRRTVRLLPGRYFRYQTTVGAHAVTVELADEAAAPTDDPNEASGQMQKVAPMHFVVASPTKGVYFVRHMAQRGSRNPDFLIMPVQPALTALRSLQPEDGANVINSSR